MWYCAHALHYFEYRDQPPQSQEEYYIWEHLYLIQADSADSAWIRAEQRALDDQQLEDESLRLNGRPANLRFASVQKIIECQGLDETSGMPIDGTELSYSKYLVSSKEEFQKWISDKSAQVLYVGEKDEE
jgi:hypothetical protein